MCKKTTLSCLLQQALEGEISEEAFRNEFCNFYYKKVYAFARNFTNSNQDAEDVTNDVFLKKILKLPLSKFQGAFQGSIESWIFVMVKRYCYTYFESNKKRRNQDELDEMTGRGCKPTINAKMDLDDTLESMSPKDREIFTLQSKGYKHKEIAKQLGLSEKAVTMAIKRWRDKH